MSGGPARQPASLASQEAVGFYGGPAQRPCRRTKMMRLRCFQSRRRSPGHCLFRNARFRAEDEPEARAARRGLGHHPARSYCAEVCAHGCSRYLSGGLRWLNKVLRVPSFHSSCAKSRRAAGATRASLRARRRVSQVPLQTGCPWPVVIDLHIEGAAPLPRRPPPEGLPARPAGLPAASFRHRCG